MNYNRGCQVNIKNVADDFFEAYLRCFEGQSKTLVNGNITTQIVAIPGFCNGFFACELYLKFLSGERINSIPNNKRHNLKILYDKLDENYKQELRSTNACCDNLTLEELLDKIGDGFIMWRYIFEEQNESFGDGHPFKYSEDFLKAYLPKLKQIAENHEKD